jgi:hypothetical protein
MLTDAMHVSLAVFFMHPRLIAHPRSRHLFRLLDKGELFFPANGDTANLSMLLSYVSFTQQHAALIHHAYVPSARRATLVSLHSCNHCEEN